MPFPDNEILNKSSLFTIIVGLKIPRHARCHEGRRKEDLYLSRPRRRSYITLAT